MSPARYTNRDQQSKSVSEMCINSNRKLWQKHLDDTAVSTSAVNQPQSAKQEHIRRSCISPRGIAVYQQPSKIKAKAFFWTTQPRVDQDGISTAKAVYQQQSTQAKALLDDTAVSTWAVSQPRTAKQKHLWPSCIPPARYSCISTAIKN